MADVDACVREGRTGELLALLSVEPTDPEAHLVQVHAAFDLGLGDRARAAEGRARHLLIRGNKPALLARAYLWLARIEAAFGDSSRAVVALSKARPIVEEVSTPELLVLQAEAHAEWAWASGDASLPTRIADLRRSASAAGDAVASAWATLIEATAALDAGCVDAAALERLDGDEAARSIPDLSWRIDAFLSTGTDRENRVRRAAETLERLLGPLPSETRAAWLGRRDRERVHRLLDAAAPAADDLLVKRFGREVFQLVSCIADGDEDPQAMFDSALRATVRATGADRGFIVLFEELEKATVRSAFRLKEEDLSPDRFRISFGVIARLVQRGRPLRVQSVSVDERFQGQASIQALGLTSFVAVPIPGEESPLGVLYLDSTSSEKAFTPEDEMLLVRFAAYLSKAVGSARRSQRRGMEVEELRLALAAGMTELQAQYRFDALVGESPKVRGLRVTLAHIARFPYPVLVAGETGTGKEIVSKAIHANSPRKDRPFVAVNCAALPRELLESELFGHVKGAFTGADRDRPGLFRTAHQGTLFLDEIGETSEDLQRKLLRVLQEGEFVPVGAVSPQKCDVRIVAATHRDLEREVKEGRFREDLYFRLKVFRVELPPLRERPTDVPILARHLLDRAEKETASTRRELAPETLEALSKYSWPGNVRELENAMRYALAFSLATIRPEHLPKEILQVPRAEVLREAMDRLGTPGSSDLKPADELWKALIARTLADCGWNQSEAAKQLGISRTTLRQKIRAFGLEAPR